MTIVNNNVQIIKVQLASLVKLKLTQAILQKVSPHIKWHTGPTYTHA